MIAETALKMVIFSMLKAGITERTLWPMLSTKVKMDYARNLF